MQFSVYQESHLGGRKVNQDRMGYSFTRDALLLVLADGMGGHLHGEIAAQLTLQVISQRFQQHATPYVKGPERFLEESLLAAHQEIHRYRLAHNLAEAPRTTVVACLIQFNSATWAHCGDSRLYWMRGGQILARTRDHSHVESLIAKGLAAPSERATHPDRNKLYNCLGATALPKIDLSGRASLLPGDQMLLCSDGLWAMLPDQDLAERMHAQTVVRAVPDMLSAALALAGRHADNATALAIMWQGSSVVDSANSVAAGDASVISTEALPQDLVGSTIQGMPAPPAAADAFDDDEIERAIAEIRGAIEKSSQVLK
ncbi:PPM family protein phosphatase [Janthinobacterium sp. CG_23.3]|uniref:PP2C family protein-serine/threonine phosphatase n=1 Tax=unclassified Janthinobacterium TaxID=2610881 RepID=UPI00034A46D5|nr:MULTISPECIES: PP2C family serine/threonine-protein phosphatase [unclassified Janthinobacterium]MEC5163714.1 serine/threonine protein phosphatase PrpC [Janthinobacterium sp. CG_S6]